MFFSETRYRTHITCVKLYSLCLSINFQYFLKNCCFVLHSVHRYVVVAPALDRDDYQTQAHQLDFLYYKILICQQTEAPLKDLRPQYYIELLAKRIQFCDAHEKPICRRTDRATRNPRPPLGSSWREEFRSVGYILCDPLFNSFLNNFPNRARAKLYPVDLDIVLTCTSDHKYRKSVIAN